LSCKITYEISREERIDLTRLSFAEIYKDLELTRKFLSLVFFLEETLYSETTFTFFKQILLPFFLYQCGQV